MKDALYKLGFTGTREGLTAGQALALKLKVQELASEHAGNIVAVHGACVGADASFDEICAELSIPRKMRPGPVPKLRMGLARRLGSFVFEPEPFEVRNKKIAEEATHLLVCPKQMAEQRYGGTWQTYRFGLRRDIQISTFFPDGTTYDRFTS